MSAPCDLSLRLEGAAGRTGLFLEVRPPRVKEQNSQRADSDLADGDVDEVLKPLTAQEAFVWRARQPVTSPWRVLGLQVLVGGLLVVLTAAISGRASLAASVAWGVVSVCVPAVVFARALSRQARSHKAGSALTSFFVWELVKIVLTVALLLVAPRVVAELNWLALVAGFVITMKVYWLAMVLHIKQRHRPPQV